MWRVKVRVSAIIKTHTGALRLILVEGVAGLATIGAHRVRRTTKSCPFIYKVDRLFKTKGVEDVVLASVQ